MCDKYLHCLQRGTVEDDAYDCSLKTTENVAAVSLFFILIKNILIYTRFTQHDKAKGILERLQFQAATLEAQVRVQWHTEGRRTSTATLLQAAGENGWLGGAAEAFQHRTAH